MVSQNLGTLLAGSVASLSITWSKGNTNMTGYHMLLKPGTSLSKIIMNFMQNQGVKLVHMKN